MKRGANRGEEALLRKFERVAQKASVRSGVRLGIGDDAALWRPRNGYEAILTCDWFLEGTHFLRDAHPPDAVGWKCLARATSDIAAMGGTARCFLLSLALPESHTRDWLARFLGGLRKASRELDCALVGGDTTRRREILINITVMGQVKKGRAVLRSGARPGDRIFVSGKLGEAALGLKLLREKKRSNKGRHPSIIRHLYPEPRLALGQWLSEKRIATAMMDLSDGISSDLARLCKASGAGARVHSARIPAASDPFSGEFSAEERLQAALHGGDDYELLFCVGKADAGKIPNKLHGVELTAIGEITNGRKIELIEPSGKARSLSAGGWDPFRSYLPRKQNRAAR